jgi:hypothetical protein
VLRQTVSRPVCLGVKCLSGAYDQFFITVRQMRVCWCGALSDERTGLPFTIAAGPRQRSHSWVRVQRDSWLYFTVSDSRLPQPGGPGPCIYSPQERGRPVIPPGTGFPFRRLKRLAGLRWRYSNPPIAFPLIWHGRHRNRTTRPKVLLLLRVNSLPWQLFFFTKPLPSNDRGIYRHTYSKIISYGCFYFFKSRLKRIFG